MNDFLMYFYIIRLLDIMDPDGTKNKIFKMKITNLNLGKPCKISKDS